MDISTIALQGLAQANAQLDVAASKLAQAGGSSPDGAGVDVVDVAAQLAALASAETLFEINLSTLKIANEIQKSVLDITA